MVFNGYHNMLNTMHTLKFNAKLDLFQQLSTDLRGRVNSESTASVVMGLMRIEEFARQWLAELGHGVDTSESGVCAYTDLNKDDWATIRELVNYRVQFTCTVNEETKVLSALHNLILQVNVILSCMGVSARKAFWAYQSACAMGEHETMLALENSIEASRR